MPPVAKKSSEEVFSLLSRAIIDGRTLSPFEKKKIERHLLSSKKAEKIDYDMASACYYSYVGDIKKLHYFSNNVFFSGYRLDSNAINVLFALFNSLQFKKVHEIIIMTDYYVPDEPDYAELAIMSCVICNDFDKAISIIGKSGDLALNNDSIREAVEFTHDMRCFFASDGEAYSQYLINVFDVFIDGLHSLNDGDLVYPALRYSFLEDGEDDDMSSIDLLHLAFIFNIEDLDFIFSAEDSFFKKISKLDYPTHIKSRVSFSFEMGVKEYK